MRGGREGKNPWFLHRIDPSRSFIDYKLPREGPTDSQVKLIHSLRDPRQQTRKCRQSQDSYSGSLAFVLGGGLFVRLR